MKTIAVLSQKGGSGKTTLALHLAVVKIPTKKEPWFEGSKESFVNRQFTSLEVFRISANSSQVVNSQGFALGLNYYFGKYYSFNGNYSYNNLITKTNDDIVPAFNTPKNKYNLGVSGRDIPVGPGKNSFGFNANYKWIEGFIFEGSPQLTGKVPTYTLVDAQINYSFPKQNLVVKTGAYSILNNKQFQTYGGPRIGRMAYITLTYDFKYKN